MTTYSNGNGAPFGEPPQDDKPTSFGEALGRFADHQRKAFDEAGRAVEALFPEGFKRHGAAAGDEVRRGFKVLVDAVIDELEKLTKQDEAERRNDDDPPSTTGSTKVKVQVE